MPSCYLFTTPSSLPFSFYRIDLGFHNARQSFRGTFSRQPERWRASATAIEAIKATTTREKRSITRDTKSITSALEMAKRKEPSTSRRPRTRSKAAKEGSETRTTEGGGIEDDEKEFCQLRCEVYPLLRALDKLSEQQRKLKHKLNQEVKQEELKVERSVWLKHNPEKAGLSLEVRRLIEDKERWDQMEIGRVVNEQTRKLKRALEEQLRTLRREEEQVQRKLLPKSNHLKDMCSTREAANTQRLLDKLPQEVWGKILDNLEENDLFPLALSCRYFREKQVELVAQTGQNGKPRCALKTTVRDVWKTFTGQPMSAECLRFCYKESEIALHGAKWIMELAAYHGHLTLLQELEKEVELDSEVFSFACAGGNLEIMKWLRSKGCPWNASACNGAAWGGHLEILKWLRSEGCPWNQRACSYAAQGGHFEVLKWLRSKGCPWDEETCDEAACHGHLDVLKWAIDNGCPYEVNYWTREAYQTLGLA